MENLFSPGVAATLMAPHELPEGVASLSRGAYFKEASLDMTLSILTESAAQMAGVERVSIWALTHDHEELRCLELFERSAGRHSSGGVLSASQYPAYFRALRSENCIAADDPGHHPSTFEFSADYLSRHQVSALLVTPIHIRGELQGTLCLEQVGPRQPWTPAHQLFAHAVANLVTLALVEFEAGQAKQQAQAANERLQAVFDASRDAMLLADADSGIILDANREAEKLFGFPRRQLVGKHRQALHPQGYGSAGQCLQARSDQASVQQVCDIQRADGGVAKVEVSAEVADLSDGRRLLLGIFRPA
jgi:PAS domain S-box-containing protein